VIGMKPMAAGLIPKSNIVAAPECLRYAMSLPTSVVVTGIDSMEVLKQALEVVKNFQPFTEEQEAQLLHRTEVAAAEGKYEQFKTSPKHDSTAQHPEWLG